MSRVQSTNSLCVASYKHTHLSPTFDFKSSAIKFTFDTTQYLFTLKKHRERERKKKINTLWNQYHYFWNVGDIIWMNLSTFSCVLISAIEIDLLVLNANFDPRWINIVVNAWYCYRLHPFNDRKNKKCK